MTGKKSDGTTASYYELPSGATELYHLIIYKNMNAQIGEIFRAAYRYGETSHSDQLRDIRKIMAYAKQEEERLLNEKESERDFDAPDYELLWYCEAGDPDRCYCKVVECKLTSHQS